MKTRTCRGRVISMALTTLGDQWGLLAQLDTAWGDGGGPGGTETFTE